MRRWESSCRLLHCNVEGKQKPPQYDLKAATEVLWWIHLVLNFQEIKQSLQSDLRDGTAPDRIVKKEANKKEFNILSLLKIWQQSLSVIAKWMQCKGGVKLVISYNFTYRCDSVQFGIQMPMFHRSLLLATSLLPSVVKMKHHWNQYQVRTGEFGWHQRYV
jgi:hypothetical protein